MELTKYFEFCAKVKTIAGHHALERIPEVLASLAARQPMILTDQGVRQIGLVDIVLEAMGKTHKLLVFDDVPPDSDVATVRNAAAFYRENSCDAIIAIGGGSVLDTSKAVNILVSENSDDLMQFVGASVLTNPLKPLITVPTTSGTGSEATLVAVIADKSRDLKMLFTSNTVLPDAAILDSRMTMTLPPFLTAATAIDALTHAVEAYYCNAKNPLSDAFAERAVYLISRHLFPLMSNPSDADSRLALAVASHLAGMAFSNSMVGMVHSIGHAVGAVCHVPHGNAMSILLPYGLEYNQHKSAKSMGRLLRQFPDSSDCSGLSDSEKTDRLVQKIRCMNTDLNELTQGRHALCLKDLRDRDGEPLVAEADFHNIAMTALGDGSINYNPEELDYEDILFVLKHAYVGKPLPLEQIKKG